MNRAVSKSAGAVGAADASASLRALMSAVRKNWAILVAGVTVAMALALVVSRMTPKVYEADALIELNMNPIRPLGDKTEGLLPNRRRVLVREPRLLRDTVQTRHICSGFERRRA